MIGKVGMQNGYETCRTRVICLPTEYLLFNSYNRSVRKRFAAPTTVLGAHNLIAQVLSNIIENLILSAALTAGSDALKLNKEPLLSEVDKLKDQISSRQNNESNLKMAELHGTYDEDLGVLKEKLRNSVERVNGLHT